MWWLNAKFPAGVTAVIQNERGEVLLLEHAFRRTWPWALPGGWIERREPPEDAIRREVREETGLEVVVERLLTARAFDLPRLDIVYVCRVVTGTVRSSPETPRWRWCARAMYPPGTDPWSMELIRLAVVNDQSGVSSS